MTTTRVLTRGALLLALFCSVAGKVRAQASETPSLFDNGYSMSRPAAAVRLIKRVPNGATLRQIKALLPRGTRYQWLQISPMGNWKRNVLRFKGAFSGVLVFANERRKYRASDADKGRVSQWRAGDAVHSVDLFLGPAVRDQSASQTVRVTKKYVETIARLVGRRGTRTFDDPDGGPPAIGWSATWKLSGARELRFWQDLSYSESDERPTLQLVFDYSHLYVA